MLADASYFTEGPRHIQNASRGRLPNADAEAVNTTIKAYIRHWQLPFLRGVFSAAKAVEVNSYLNALDNDLCAEHDEEIDNVVEQLREPFANYVFFKILRDANTQATVTGLVRLKCANEYVAPIQRQVNTWNDMVEMMRGYREWAQAEGYASWLGKGDNLISKINTLNL